MTTEVQETKQEESQEATVTQPTRKQLLMERAKALGIKFSNNITEDKLAALIEEKLGVNDEPNPLETEPDDSGLSFNEKCIRDSMKLVRVRISCMDQKKANLRGEFHTVANKFIGTVRRFIPYDNEEGWHVEQCILDTLRDKTFLKITTKVDPKTKIPVTETADVKEFNIEVLDPLTPAELEALAADQRNSGRVG